MLVNQARLAADLVGMDALDALSQPGPLVPDVAAVASELDRLRREFSDDDPISLTS